MVLIGSVRTLPSLRVAVAARKLGEQDLPRMETDVSGADVATDSVSGCAVASSSRRHTLRGKCSRWAGAWILSRQKDTRRGELHPAIQTIGKEHRKVPTASTAGVKCRVKRLQITTFLRGR